MSTKPNLKSLSLNTKIFLGFLILITIFAYLLFLLFIDELRPINKVFTTTFTTSKQTKVELSIEEIGFFFDTKKYHLNFAPPGTVNSNVGSNCSHYTEISPYIGKQFSQQYTFKVDLNQMFEIQNDKVILFQDLQDLYKPITDEKRKENNFNSPYIIIPENFYMKDCR